MNNLTYGFNNYNQPFNNLQNFYTTSRSGEPIFVNNLESARSFQTIPNTVTILFDKNENIFYRIETDANNAPDIKLYRYAEEQPALPEDAKYVTLEEFNKFKEEILNGRQYICDDATESNSTTVREPDSASPTGNKHTGSKSRSIANTSKPSI